METSLPSSIVPSEGNPWKGYVRSASYFIAALLVFLFSLDLMISSFHYLGSSVAEVVILATSNPFTGLYIGLLVTAIVQSSSATTSLVVALVASGSMSLQGAVPVIMGANVGTTITSTIVSLSFITKKKEFRRAVAAGTYHDFFNILTVFILFPLEYYYGFLSGLSQFIATTFFNEPTGPVAENFSFLGTGFNPLINFLRQIVGNGYGLVAISIVLLFGSILFFRKALTDILGFGSQERFKRFFFRSPLKPFVWGLLTTAAIRSSTVTTSMVVPLVAKRIIRLKAAAPFILGANIGTTITAFIASSFNSNAAISIAIAHFLFNFIGVLIFFRTPILKEIPIYLANGLGRLTMKYRITGFVYLLMTFFFVPFSLIYINKESISVRELTYIRHRTGIQKDEPFTVISKNYENNQFSWTIYDQNSDNNLKLVSVSRQGRTLTLNNESYELNKPGYCRNGENADGKYTICVVEILPKLKLKDGLIMDSIYVFERKSLAAGRKDSLRTYSYISSIENLLVMKEKRDKNGDVMFSEVLSHIIKK